MFELRLPRGGGALLRRALVPLLDMSLIPGVRELMHISPGNTTLIATFVPGPAPRLIALRFQQSIFSHYQCNESVWLGLSIQHLYNSLLEAGRDDLLGISGSLNDDYISLVLINDRTDETRAVQMDLSSIRHGQMTVLFRYEYQVIVGIPSELFRNLVMVLWPAGLEVSARVTDTQVTISVGDVKVAIRKELEQCIIGGSVSEEHPITLVFGFHDTMAVINAARLSGMVWLLGQSNGPSVMLNIPVGALGNLMFYFSAGD